MDNTDYDAIMSLATALHSKTCLTILEYLRNKDASNQELYDKLKDKVEIEYRSSIFEALKRIKKAGLVEKYYDDDDNQIKYKLKFRRITLDLDKMDITME